MIRKLEAGLKKMFLRREAARAAKPPVSRLSLDTQFKNIGYHPRPPFFGTFLQFCSNFTDDIYIYILVVFGENENVNKRLSVCVLALG